MPAFASRYRPLPANTGSHRAADEPVIMPEIGLSSKAGASPGRDNSAWNRSQGIEAPRTRECNREATGGTERGAAMRFILILTTWVVASAASNSLACNGGGMSSGTSSGTGSFGAQRGSGFASSGFASAGALGSTALQQMAMRQAAMRHALAQQLANQQFIEQQLAAQQEQSLQDSTNQPALSRTERIQQARAARIAARKAKTAAQIAARKAARERMLAGQNQQDQSPNPAAQLAT